MIKHITSYITIAIISAVLPFPLQKIVVVVVVVVLVLKKKGEGKKNPPRASSWWVGTGSSGGGRLKYTNATIGGEKAKK